MADFDIVDAHSLHWLDAEHTKLAGTVLFECYKTTIGYLPFMANDAYMPYKHERVFWEKGNAGDFGPILEYVVEQPEPDPEPEPETEE